MYSGRVCRPTKIAATVTGRSTWQRLARVHFRCSYRPRIACTVSRGRFRFPFGTPRTVRTRTTAPIAVRDVVDGLRVGFLHA